MARGPLFCRWGPILAALAAVGLGQISALKTQMRITQDIESRRLMFEIKMSFDAWVRSMNDKWDTLEVPPRFGESLVRLSRDAVEIGYAEDYKTYEGEEYAELREFVGEIYSALNAYVPQFFSLMNERGDELYQLFGYQYVKMMNTVCVVRLPSWIEQHAGDAPVANAMLALQYSWGEKMGMDRKSVAVMPAKGAQKVNQHEPEWKRRLPLNFDGGWAKGMTFTRRYDLR